MLNGLRDKIKGEKPLVIIFGSEVRGADVKALVDFGLAQGAKFVCLGDYANSRGAADMGLYPDMLPGYAPVASTTQYHEEWLDEIPNAARHELAADDGRSEGRQAEGAVRCGLQSDRALQR